MWLLEFVLFAKIDQACFLKLSPSHLLFHRRILRLRDLQCLRHTWDVCGFILINQRWRYDPSLDFFFNYVRWSTCRAVENLVKSPGERTTCWEWWVKRKGVILEISQLKGNRNILLQIFLFALPYIQLQVVPHRSWHQSLQDEARIPARQHEARTWDREVHDCKLTDPRFARPQSPVCLPGPCLASMYTH